MFEFERLKPSETIWGNGMVSEFASEALQANLSFSKLQGFIGFIFLRMCLDYETTN